FSLGRGPDAVAVAAGIIIPVSADLPLAIDAGPVGYARPRRVECRDRAVGRADKTVTAACIAPASGNRTGVVDAVGLGAGRAGDVDLDDLSGGSRQTRCKKTQCHREGRGPVAQARAGW